MNGNSTPTPPTNASPIAQPQQSPQNQAMPQSPHSTPQPTPNMKHTAQNGQQLGVTPPGQTGFNQSQPNQPPVNGNQPPPASSPANHSKPGMPCSNYADYSQVISGTPPASAMAPPSAPPTQSPRPPQNGPNVPQGYHPSMGHPPGNHPRHPSMANPAMYGHGYPNGFRPQGHHGPPGSFPQRPGYSAGPMHHGHGQMHQGYPPRSAHPGQAQHPMFHGGQYNGQRLNTPTSNSGPNAAAQAAAAAVAAAKAQGQPQGQRPPFHPGMSPQMNGMPRPGFPPHHMAGPRGPMMGPGGMSHHGMRPHGRPMPPSSQGPPNSVHSGYNPMMHPGVKPDVRSMDGPMSPASSIGDGDHSSPRPGRPPSAASSQGSETPVSTPKPTTAKNRQKLMVLYEPEHPDRRRLIDELIKFHEDKGQPLKVLYCNIRFQYLKLF